TRAGLSMTLQKLTGKGLIQVRDNGNKRETEEKNTVRQLDIVLLKEADPIVENLMTAQKDFRQMMFAGFGEEEVEQYLYMNEKIRSNIQKALK
ncbi:MAG: glycosyltransferase family 2 protein, partial [Oliverpabstia sp.]